MRRAVVEYQTARMAEVMGAEVTSMPDLVEERRRFDDMLCAPPRASTMDPDEAALRYALGIRGGG